MVLYQLHDSLDLRTRGILRRQFGLKAVEFQEQHRNALADVIVELARNFLTLFLLRFQQADRKALHQAPLRQVFDGARDGRAQAAQPVLQQIIGRAQFDALDSLFVADGSTDNNKRNVKAAGAEQFERAHRVPSGQRVIGKDHIDIRLQLRHELGLRSEEHTSELQSRQY